MIAMGLLTAFASTSLLIGITKRRKVLLWPFIFVCFGWLVGCMLLAVGNIYSFSNQGATARQFRYWSGSGARAIVACLAFVMFIYHLRMTSKFYEEIGSGMQPKRETDGRDNSRAAESGRSGNGITNPYADVYPTPQPYIISHDLDLPPSYNDACFQNHSTLSSGEAVWRY